MLKLKINKDELINDLVRINVFEVESEPFKNTDDDEISDDLIVTCYHDDEHEILENDKVMCTYTMLDWNESNASIVRTYTVSNTDNVEHSITFVSDNLIDLNASHFYCVRVKDYVDSDDAYITSDYVYVYFNQFHFFEDAEYTLWRTVTFENEEYPPGVTIFFTDDNGMTLNCIGEPFSIDCIRFPVDRTETADQSIGEYDSLVRENRLMALSLFRYYGIIGVNEDNWEEVADKIFNDDMVLQEYDAAPFSYKRYNMMFDDNKRLSLDLIKPNVSVSLPLFSNFSNDLYQEYDVSDNFVEVEKRKAINSYTEFEKDVYVPVYKDQSVVKNITEIHFNLHFRQRTGDDWKVIQSSSWNGVTPNGEPMGSSNLVRYGFFSYQDKGEQSDLLSYLGFSDSDVKYRRNILKKSFLRLLFYDSDSPMSQNLLCYSTVFVNTGKLFGKYTRNFSYPKHPDASFGYSRILSNGDTKMELSGGRVNREPYWGGAQYDNSLIESLRLSSQFVVKDKYSSDNSSEGFYLYLWKDFANENSLSDIYMKVEFNHAGFGRVIPFMMPYDRSGNVKSFEEIVNDDGYGVKEYLRYSYIHFKCGYEDGDKCVYYLDNNQYKSNISFSGGVLSLNLYEAKLRDEND